ncbi:hypothetical protein HAX54_007004, partial [Datura stramonium]|nr:hypothetical protein [Datura stramonium]
SIIGSVGGVGFRLGFEKRKICKKLLSYWLMGATAVVGEPLWRDCHDGQRNMIVAVDDRRQYDGLGYNLG